MKILVCVDGSEQSMNAVQKALDIVSDCKTGEVSFIHVLEDIKKSYWLAMGEGYSPSREEMSHLVDLENQKRQEKDTMLKEAARPFEDLGITVERLIRMGHPAHTITTVADQGNFDMIIIGSRGLGGFRKMLLGSVSNAVIQETKRSVLVVK